VKFYIASKLENASQVRQLAKVLKSWGWQHTYDWTGYEPAQMKEIALNEYAGVINADLVIVLLPGGRGTHTELGIATATGKKIVLHSEDPVLFDEYFQAPCPFYWLPGVKRVCCPFSELLGWLEQRFGSVVMKEY